MIPISTTQDLLDRWEEFFAKEQTSRSFIVYAVMLYTTEHTTLIKYIRDKWNKLHYDLWDSMHLYVFERPVSKKNLTAAQAFWNKMELLQGNPQEDENITIPYDATQCSMIGDAFRIPTSEFPCLVFFKRIDYRNILVCSFHKDLSESQLDDEFEAIIEGVKDVKWNVVDEMIKSNGFEGREEELSDKLYSRIRDKQWEGIKKYVSERSNWKLDLKYKTLPYRKPFRDVLRTIGDKLADKAIDKALEIV